ncbi:TonB-dependent receptor, partial [Phenylobacterium sp.]|uniref:TonB-dependent receptor n=1 Tax=Phenylobacterium sp. TaxID=1871053 RepID=UPI0025FDDE0C
DKLSFVLNAGASYTGVYCCSSTVRVSVNPTRAFGLSAAAFGVVPGPNNFEVAADGDVNGWGRLQNISLTAEYDWNGFQVTSISAYNQTKRRNFYDADLASYNFANGTGQYINFQSTSQELRVVSPLGEKFDYVAGLYYSHQNNLGLIAQAGTFTAPLAGTIVAPPTAVVGANGARAHVTGDSYAAFGQGAFHFNDQLSLRVGGRVTRDELKLNYTTGGVYDPSLPLLLGVPAPVAPPATPPFASFNHVGFDGPYVTPCFRLNDPAVVSGTRRANCFPAIEQQVSETNFSWRVTLDNQFTPDVMGYVTVARGYKGPGFSALTLGGALLTAGAIDQSIKPEIPTSYEAGLKSSFFDRRLVVNVAAFVTDYKDFQAQVTIPIGIGGTTTTVSRILNAGSLKSRGIEAQVVAAPVSGLTVSVAATYLDNEYGDFPGVPCWAHTEPTPPYPASPPQPGCGVAPNLPGTVNAKGNRVAGAPEFQSAVVVSYDRPNLISSLTGHFSASWNWQSDVNYLPNADPFAVQKSFGLLGGQVGLSTDDGRYRVSLFATNLLNKHWVSNISPYPVQALNPGGYAQNFGPEAFRHVGVSLDAKF